MLCLVMILRRVGPGKPSTWRPISFWAFMPVNNDVWPVALCGVPGMPSIASIGVA